MKAYRCLTISRTLIFPFKLSHVILRHFSFPHTSTFSAFEVSYKNELYKFTVIIIIIIIIIIKEYSANILKCTKYM